ncbi:cytochrome P450 72A68-like [Neltuma alba]|uniref:cytochrome P450 72A68-like n=1 Tax=Neltuma alba TaxID=207710 RepID=UPI0010A46338|nr:cytochrome P450 72A68-like [Prosopis alba]
MAVIGGGWWVWKMAKWVWVDPKKMERRLREEGLRGHPYRFWVGDLTRMANMQKQATSSPLPSHSHDVISRVLPFDHHLVTRHGKNPFMWYGPTPRLILTDPELNKNVLNNNYDFVKLPVISVIKYLSAGIASYNGDKWANHRKIINPAFILEKLKTLIPITCQSCNEMINKWENMLSPTDGTCEVDVLPWLKGLTKEVISRAAFGSSYEEGRQIFDILSEQTELVANNLQKHRIPLWRFLPTKDNKRMKQNERNMEASLECIINKKKEAMQARQATKDDLLGILLESNQKEIEEQGNKKNVGLSIKDVIGECKLFYLAGQETISSLLVWTMMLLSMYPDWQARAREEVLQVFGNQKPDFDALSRLKIVTMIMYEALRLYPPIAWAERCTEKDMKLGNLSIPKGVRISLPIIMMHHDERFWGDDAKEFKPDRFSKGISNASKGSSVAFFPFGWGPRICIGQNFAFLEAKTVFSLILQRFSFELSPTYAHAPMTVLTLQPQHGVQVILHKL